PLVTGVQTCALPISPRPRHRGEDAGTGTSTHGSGARQFGGPARIQRGLRIRRALVSPRSGNRGEGTGTGRPYHPVDPREPGRSRSEERRVGKEARSE